MRAIHQEYFTLRRRHILSAMAASSVAVLSFAKEGERSLTTYQNDAARPHGSSSAVAAMMGCRRDYIRVMLFALYFIDTDGAGHAEGVFIAPPDRRYGSFYIYAFSPARPAPACVASYPIPPHRCRNYAERMYDAAHAVLRFLMISVRAFLLSFAQPLQGASYSLSL